MSWTKSKIGDILTLKRGYDLPKASRTLGEIPVVSSAGVTDYHNKVKKSGQGVITGRYGTLGKVFYVEGNYWPLNTTLYIKDFKGNDPKFIYYFLKTLRLERFNGAAAVPGLDRNILHKIEVSYTKDINIQKKIASILTAYDDLIENNNQRIKLLEEMAEEIYKEWFVRLRFPGFETTKFFDKAGNEVPHGTTGALPEGWEKRKREDVFDKIVLGGTPSRSNEKFWTEGSIPWIKSGKLNDKFILEGSEYITESALNKSATELLPKSSVLIAITGAIIIGFSEIELCANQSVIGIYKGLISQSYLFLDQLYNQHYYEDRMTGSAQQHINKEVVNNYKIIVPSQNIDEKFDKLISPMFKEIGLLKKKNKVIQETRDLLLPRLISGKLSVKNIEIEQNLMNV